MAVVTANEFFALVHGQAEEFSAVDGFPGFQSVVSEWRRASDRAWRRWLHVIAFEDLAVVAINLALGQNSSRKLAACCELTSHTATSFPCRPRRGRSCVVSEALRKVRTWICVNEGGARKRLLGRTSTPAPAARQPAEKKEEPSAGHYLFQHGRVPSR